MQKTQKRDGFEAPNGLRSRGSSTTAKEKEKRRKEKEIQENLKKDGKTWEKEKQQNERL